MLKLVVFIVTNKLQIFDFMCQFDTFLDSSVICVYVFNPLGIR